MASEVFGILIERGNINAVEECIKNKEDVNGIYRNRSLLAVAIEHSAWTGSSYSDAPPDNDQFNCYDEIVRLLINAGANVNVNLQGSRGSSGSPLLLALACKVHCKVIYDLINAGANVNAEDRRSENALMCAIRANYNRSVISYLIKKGANVNHRSNSGQTPLQAAFNHVNSFEIASELINEGAFVSMLGPNNLSHRCELRCKNQRFVDLLVEKGMDLKAIDSFGRSILHYTSCNYLINLCVKSGLSINSIDNHGDTPLLCAVQKKCLVEKDINEICELLLYHGGDLFAKDVKNKTPLDYVNIEELPNGYMYFNGHSICREPRKQRFGIIKHMLLFYSETPFNDQIKNFSDKHQVIINTFIDNCLKELTEMKNTFLANNLSFYEFCKLKRFSKSRFINLPDNEYKYTHDEIEKMFPLYKYLINLRIEDNKMKTRKWNLVCQFENITVRPKIVDESSSNNVILLYDCMYFVACHLNHRELYNVFLAAVD